MSYGVDGMSHRDLMRTRMEREAEAILEGVMMRRNWSAETRDALAAKLAVLVEKEIERANIRGGKR